MSTVKLNIDGREIEVERELNLIEAARRLGILIPHFCYHPGLGVDGNCRMCLVEVEGQAKPAIACNTFARDLVTKDGVRKVFTANPRVKEWQAAVLEFLFLNHPLDCPICDQSGECFLQDFYMTNGQYQSRLDTPKVHKRKVVDVGPRVKLDAERCVLCTRCIRFCDQVTGTGELYIVNRGNRAEITNYPGLPLENDYSLNTVDICPVGALTGKEFRFRKRVWYLTSSHSVCTGCARGCNIYLEHHDGVVYRYRPRENMAVNQYWMCDYGRETYHPLNEDRLEIALRGTADVPFAVAMAEAAGWLRAATGPETLLLVSPVSSNETLFAAKRFAREVLGGARVAGAGTRPAGVEDKLLRRADLYPNTAGLEMLGLARDPEPELRRGGALLVVVEDDPLDPRQRPQWREHFARFTNVLYLGSNAGETSRAAGLSLPVTPHSECDGTFVNFEGRVQRFRRAVRPMGDALWGPELFRRLHAAMEGGAGAAMLGGNGTEAAATGPAAGTGASGAGADGTGAARTGAAGTGVARTGAVGTGAAGTGAAGTGAAGSDAAQTGAAGTGAVAGEGARGARAGGSWGWGSLPALWRALSTEEPAFAGMDVTRLGAGGALAGGPPSSPPPVPPSAPAARPAGE